MKFLIPLFSFLFLLSACSTPVTETSQPSEALDSVETVDPAVAEHSRNAVRKNDLQKIAVALEWYSVDADTYPIVSECLTLDGVLNQDLALYFGSDLPQNELKTFCSGSYFYQTYENGKAYALAAALEAAGTLELGQKDVYCGVVDETFFSTAKSLADLKDKLASYPCEETTEASKFTVFMHQL